ncbi:hypothetical protein ACVIHI_001502 [Bradyrhizobium sp. USDA 4524]|nr:hypothetical protein [Bradyrhizobium sp. USDA 4538]MCP1906141.1 hypothetical protein [Bradyrhizobium sp. USDA 4537]MCP1988205.1 hypothetical protein [Bradyrhizobium sp. USDA 4539]
MVHERLLAYRDFPAQMAITLAVLPVGGDGNWKLVIGQGKLRNDPIWYSRTRTIEAQLQNLYSLRR